jgi:hypothetical protein
MQNESGRGHRTVEGNPAAHGCEKPNTPGYIQASLTESIQHCDGGIVLRGDQKCFATFFPQSDYQTVEGGGGIQRDTGAFPKVSFVAACNASSISSDGA